MGKIQILLIPKMQFQINGWNVYTAQKMKFSSVIREDTLLEK